MQKPHSASSYQDQVDGWVSANATQAVEWTALLEAVPGVYPAIVRDSAVRLGLWTNVVHSKRLSDLPAVGSVAVAQWLEGHLRTPHPVDSCWWFSDGTLEALAKWVPQLSSRCDLVALLGAPTLFHYLKRQRSDRNILLVDRAVCSKSGARGVLQADLLQRHPTFPGPAAVVIVDPPWYSPEMRAFLWSARSISSCGTKILLSAPPIGTRPEIDREWQELAQWCEEIGLRMIERWPLQLRYLSPAFETNALQADGVPECPIDWRRGDLVLLECDENRTLCSLAPKPRMYPSWNDHSIGRSWVKIRSARTNGEQQPVLYEIVPNDVLPSVSRRDHRLREVALWTSGNRVFGSRNVLALRAIIEAMESGSNAIAALMKQFGQFGGNARMREVELALARLRKVFEAEECELEEWNRRLNANMVQLAS